MEFRARHADGSWRVLETTGQNLLDDPGIGGVLITSRDVTEQRRGDAALRDSEEWFRLLAEQSQDAIFRRSIAADGPFDYVSPSVEAMTGYTPEELCSDPDILRKLVHPDDVPIVVANARALATTDVQAFELRWIRKDGGGDLGREPGQLRCGTRRARSSPSRG